MTKLIAPLAVAAVALLALGAYTATNATAQTHAAQRKAALAQRQVMLAQRQVALLQLQANRCGSEDSSAWNWARCGNRQRHVVTMWGTPKTVTCGGLRWLVRHGDLDEHTPWLRGDHSCGRRR